MALPGQGLARLESRVFHVNFHESIASPRMMKENRIAARGCLMSCKSFGALTPHVNLIPATNSYPKLLPLSTHSKQGRVLSWGHRQPGRLAAHSRVAFVVFGF